MHLSSTTAGSFSSLLTGTFAPSSSFALLLRLLITYLLEKIAPRNTSATTGAAPSATTDGASPSATTDGASPSATTDGASPSATTTSAIVILILGRVLEVSDKLGVDLLDHADLARLLVDRRLYDLLGGLGGGVGGS